jgi:hypothetical protein
MIKRFCDRCGGEMPESASTRRLKNSDTRGDHTFSVEVIVSVDGICNAGDICAGCVKELVMKAPMDGRTKPIPDAPAAPVPLDPA